MSCYVQLGYYSPSCVTASQERLVRFGVPPDEAGSCALALLYVDIDAMPGIIHVPFPIPHLPDIFRLCAGSRIPGTDDQLVSARTKGHRHLPEAPRPGLRLL